MTEKVLGFKEKDASLENPGIWIIDMNKLVPVVSVEWLEKYCKDHKAITKMSPKEWVCIKYLLSAVRQQAKLEVKK